MKLFVQIILIYSIFISLFSCAQIDKIQEAEKVYYFDLTSVVDSAIEDLSRRSPKVKKEISYDGESNSLDLSEINWKDELEVFEDADINKPILKNSYETTVKEMARGYSMTRYEASGPRELVRWLEVEKDQNGEIQKVAFKIVTDNSLYASEKEGTLVFTKGRKLKSYSIEGVQSIVFLGDKHYSVAGNLVY